MADEERKSKAPIWFGLVPALAGLIGGAVSGFTTAYVQLSTKREEYSIQRAKEFQSLMEKLADKNTARLAVLNLWQLYPEERDRRIITAAAFAVGQPDLVEIINGIDEELEPVSDMLHARALSDDPEVSDPALQTLIKVDPVRGAGVLIRRLQTEIEINGDRLRFSSASVDPVRELARLVSENTTVDQMVREELRKSPGFLLDYVLYRAGNSSGFIDLLVGAYAEKSELKKSSDYLLRAEFREGDKPVVVNAAGEFIISSLKQSNGNVFDVVDALSGLKNPDFRRVVASQLSTTMPGELGAVIVDPARNDTLRARALFLLRQISPSEALQVLAKAIVLGQPGAELTETMQALLNGGLINHLARTQSGFVRPDCDETDIAACTSEREVWTTWLRQTDGG